MPVERYPAPFPGDEQLLPKIPTVELRRVLGNGVGGVAESAAQTRRFESWRSYFRRQFYPSKKNSELVSRGKKGYGSQWVLIVDAKGLPLSIALGDGSQNEKRLVSPAFDRVPRPLRKHLNVALADGGFYSRPLSDKLRATFGIHCVTPEYSNAVKRFQDRRRQRRLTRRWAIERTIAWLKTHPRIAKRRERLAANYLGFLQLACLLVLLRGF